MVSNGFQMGFTRFYFQPYLGKMKPILTHMFQMGWFNHQLVLGFLLIKWDPILGGIMSTANRFGEFSRISSKKKCMVWGNDS